MSALRKFTVTVEPSMPFSQFPIDMLRYDGLFPKRGVDVTAIETSLAGNSGNRQVELNGYHPKGWYPEADRWQSFGWQVVQVESER